MGYKILIVGSSGTGKSTSIRTLPEEETLVIKCLNKELPFKKGDTRFKSITVSKAQDIIKAIVFVKEKRPNIKYVVIDDLIYLSVSTFMNRSREKGYDKFVDIATELYEVLTLPDKIEGDLIFIYLTHSETNPTTLETNVRTIGKMVSEKVVPEGLFTIVLETAVVNGEYKFLTHNVTGNSIVKTPLEMFDEDYIDNDLAKVVKAVKEYY